MRNGPNRTIAIGDIHGCSQALAALLSAIDPRPSDAIITLGDYVNRGPDSRGVIEQLLALAQRCSLIPLVGNHDEVLLDVVHGRAHMDRLLSMGGVRTLESYGANLEAIPASHLQFLRTCFPYHETASHLFVHANYAPNLLLSETDANTLTWLSLRTSVPGPHYSGRIAVLGHTPQENGQPLDLGHLICLDTGCVFGGKLTAIELETGRLWQTSEVVGF